jgi:hypothetical protein
MTIVFYMFRDNYNNVKIVKLKAYNTKPSYNPYNNIFHFGGIHEDTIHPYMTSFIVNNSHNKITNLIDQI